MQETPGVEIVGTFFTNKQTLGYIHFVARGRQHLSLANPKGATITLTGFGFGG